LKAVGARRMSFIGAYTSEIVALGQRYFSESGFDVLAATGMNIDDDHEIGRVEPDAVYRFAKANVAPGSDAVFISCTNLQTVGAIAALEEGLGIPVISSIQASFWQCLRMAHVPDRIMGFGSLFTH
jgi:maleate isomerase